MMSSVPFSVKERMCCNSFLDKGLVIMLCSWKGTLCFSSQAFALRHDVQLGDKNSVIMLSSSLHTFLFLLYKKIKRLTSYFRKKKPTFSRKIGFLESNVNVLLKYRHIHVTKDSFFLHFIWNQ